MNMKNLTFEEEELYKILLDRGLDKKAIIQELESLKEEHKEEILTETITGLLEKIK